MIGENSHENSHENVASLEPSLLNALCCGDIPKVKELLLSFPWNHSIAGLTLGEIALEHNQSALYNWLVEEGCRSEFLLKMVGQAFQNEQLTLEKSTPNSDYLKSKLTFDDHKVVDEDNNAVMCSWEHPLMELHAKLICPKGARVLNVGFGMGIIDTMLQELGPSHHTIIEAHPDVYANMVADGWTSKPNVTVIFGRWQDVLDQLQVYDGIFFDTFGEYYDDLKEFNDHVPNILDENGIYSFFNGLCGTNRFFHDVSCRIVECDLNECEMQVEFQDVHVDDLGDDIWKGTRRKYWTLDTYRLPKVTFR